MANMFDYLDDEEERNRSISVIAPTAGNSSSGGNIFDFLDELPDTTTPTTRREPLISMDNLRSSHASTDAPIQQDEPNYKAAWIKGTLGSLAGRALTPLAEKITGKEVDLSTLPEQKTLGEKAVSFAGSNLSDLPAWVSGDALLARPLAALAKTEPIAKAASLLPKAITPALGTGVRAGSTYALPINAAESVVDGEGIEGFTERLKEAPLMALGGTALHGAGQLVGKGITSGVDYAKFNKLTRLPEIKTNPLDDIQNAYKNPVTLRDAQAQALSRTFADTPNLMSPVKLKPLQQGIDDAVGVRNPLPIESVKQRELDAQSVFGGPRELKQYKVIRSEEKALAELQDGIKVAQEFQGGNKLVGDFAGEEFTNAAAMDNIKHYTGVDLPKLLSNWERTQNVKGPLAQSERLMGRKAGVIPPLKQREGFPLPDLEPQLPQRSLTERPSPLTWTNREGAQNAGPLPIRSITPENVRKLPGQESPPGAELRPKSELLRIAPAVNQPPLLQGNAETFRSKVDRNPVKGKSFTETLKGIRTQFVDDLAPLENLEKGVTGKVASAEDSLYKQGRLFRGSPERAGELIKSSLEPVIKQVEKSGKTTKDLGDYALAVHAKDVNAKGINSGFTDEEIAATIQKYGTPEMEAARKELMKISNDSLNSLAEAGIIEESLVTALREKHPNYMPLFRSFDDDKIEFASGVSKALANVTSPIERLKGSDRNVIDPIESMVKNVYRTVSAVDRNKVALQLGGLADKDANAAFIRRLPEGEERARLNSVYAMEEGKRVHYEVQPDVYKALMNLDKESSNILIRMLQKPASLLRAGATLTPEFSLRNPMRDIPAAFAVSKSGLNPVTDIPKALFDVIRSKRGKETLYNQFLKDNAGYGNIISMDRKVHQEVMNDILSQPASKKFVNIVSGKSLVGVLRSIADVSESATKLGEYKAALRSGASRPEAAYRARDIMDFSRAGASIRETNKIVAFLNANIQGKSKLYRSIKEDPVGVTARAFTSVTLPTVGAFMAQKYLANDRQKTIIEGAEDWLTSSFWLVPVPGTDQVARIPKPFDLAPMFANLPERTLKYIFDNDPEAFDGFAKQTLASTSIPTMITGLIPFVEGMANYSFFRQAPIIPQRESDLNFPDQYDIRTTETAKLLAKGVNKLTDGQGPLRNFGSPRIMDNTIKGATAGLGAYATSAIDFVAETSGLVDKKQKPARNISELPLLRAFLTSEKSDKSLGKVYDEKDKLTRDKGSAKIDSPKAKFPEEKRLKQLNETTGKIGDMTKEIRKIENDKSLSPLVKRERINSLNEKRNVLARKVTGN